LLPDGKSVLTVTGWKEQTAIVWDLASGKVQRRLSLPAGRPHAVDPAGTTLAVAGEDHNICLYDLTTGKERGRLEGHKGRLLALAVSTDGKRLASAGEVGPTVRLCDVATGQVVQSFDGGRGYALVFSAGDTLLAVGGDDQGVLLWDIAAGKERLRLPNDGTFWARACTVCFSPDGRTLATGSMNGQIRLWEVATGKVRHRMEGLQSYVSVRAFSADGRYLLTGSSDTSALVWDLWTPWRKTEPLTEEMRKGLWTDLSSDDAPLTYQAILRLAADAERAVPFLKGLLTPVPRADDKRVALLVAQLDSDDFATREKATAELAKIGEGAAGALRKVLAGNPALELRRRCERLLERWDTPVPSGERLRTLRALEVLEAAGTKEARESIQRLADGAEGAWLTREAEAALGRLAWRTRAQP
jgi:hypothetical protein